MRSRALALSAKWRGLNSFDVPVLFSELRSSRLTEAKVRNDARIKDIWRKDRAPVGIGPNRCSALPRGERAWPLGLGAGPGDLWRKGKRAARATRPYAAGPLIRTRTIRSLCEGRHNPRRGPGLGQPARAVIVQTWCIAARRYTAWRACRLHERPRVPLLGGAISATISQSCGGICTDANSPCGYARMPIASASPLARGPALSE